MFSARNISAHSPQITALGSAAGVGSINIPYPPDTLIRSAFLYWGSSPYRRFSFGYGSTSGFWHRSQTISTIHTRSFVAERAGFEPTDLSISNFPGWHDKPLCHLSSGGTSRVRTPVAVASLAFKARALPLCQRSVLMAFLAILITGRGSETRSYQLIRCSNPLP